jgi:hypothetical protein
MARAATNMDFPAVGVALLDCHDAPFNDKINVA